MPELSDRETIKEARGQRGKEAGGDRIERKRKERKNRGFRDRRREVE